MKENKIAIMGEGERESRRERERESKRMKMRGWGNWRDKSSSLFIEKISFEVSLFIPGFKVRGGRLSRRCDQGNI